MPVYLVRVGLEDREPQLELAITADDEAEAEEIAFQQEVVYAYLIEEPDAEVEAELSEGPVHLLSESPI